MTAVVQPPKIVSHSIEGNANINEEAMTSMINVFETSPDTFAQELGVTLFASESEVTRDTTSTTTAAS